MRQVYASCCATSLSSDYLMLGLEMTIFLSWLWNMHLTALLLTVIRVEHGFHSIPLSPMSNQFQQRCNMPMIKGSFIVTSNLQTFSSGQMERYCLATLVLPQLLSAPAPKNRAMRNKSW